MAKVNKKQIEEFIKVLRQASKDKALFEAFLKDILTPVEVDEMAIRWQIVKRLARGQSHREISEDLGVGLATVTRGARMMLNPSGGFNRALNKHLGNG